VRRLSESDHPDVVVQRQRSGSRQDEHEANVQRIAEATAAQHGRILEGVPYAPRQEARA